MGKGRKTRSLSVKEKDGVNWARNLPSNKLGAMVFGCKNHTLTECFDLEIFGLPAAHYSYVRNVTPGLPLFLFNYSDRMLHGVFEAVSSGQMNISRHAWITSEGAATTPYPAQVRVRVLRKCRPLPEEEFKTLIANNYYKERLFWFELDKGQAKRLMNIFLSSTSPEKIPRADEYSGMAETYAPTKKRTELFKPSSSLCPEKNEEVLESKKGGLNSSMSDCFDMERKIASSSKGRNELLLEACPDSANTECDSNVVECWEDNVCIDNDLKATYENIMACLQCHDTESADSDYVPAKELGEAFIDTNKEVSGIDLAPPEICEREHFQPNLTDRSFQEVNYTTSGGLMNMLSSDSLYAIVKPCIMKFLQEIEGLKASQLEQGKRIESLEHELVHSKGEVDHLKNRFHKMESVPSCARDHCNMEYFASSNSTNEESVFVVGGFDGNSWLPDLSLYSPSQDRVTSLCPMNFPRSYSSVAKLNGELYVLGGAYDGVWYDIVESYNPISNQWAPWHSLNKRKGSLAGASMDGKIFAIGGGNGVECFSDVELFDPNNGGWVSMQPMMEKRFAPAAADMNGALYVVGGYDGRNYLRSVERLDPRQQAWSSLCDMNLKRGCHSLVAFKERLYALGGYNGGSMVPTVEVLDPRFGSWTVDKPMTISRGYFGSFALGDKIYVIGGAQDRNILDVIECYSEESGWQVMGKTALGKRTFFSTIVL